MILRNLKLSFSTMRMLLSSKLRSRSFFFFLEKVTAMHLELRRLISTVLHNLLFS